MRVLRWTPVLGLLACGGAWGGGHFDVDDAGTLAPGRCQYEVWMSRSPGHGTAADNNLHLGPACRVGPVEVGFNVDRFAVSGERTSVVLGPQVKWTFLGDAADARWSAALSSGLAVDVARGGRAGGQFVVPVTWMATPHLQVNANLGADWSPGDGGRTVRKGVALEWALTDALSLIAERNRASGMWASRVGARISVAPDTSIDLGFMRLGPERLRTFTLGLNREFSRQ
ncbi:hypothetical protein ACSFBC_27205 [Variovorax sp. LT1R16]